MKKRKDRILTGLLGDARLDKRLKVLTEQLNAMPTAMLPQALSSWSSLKAGYRFMNNAHVTQKAIIETERQETLQRLSNMPAGMVLAVQDTTSFNFGNRPALEGLGVLEDNQTPGFFAHTTLAVSEKGVPLGVLDQQVWSRSQNRQRDKEAHKFKPITEKESFKWLQGLRHLHEIEQHVVVICDREADIYELFQHVHEHDLDLIVRAVRNRRLEEAPLLRDHLGDIVATDHFQVIVQRQRNQAERTASVELRYATVTLLPPKRQKSAEAFPLTPQQLQVVEVKEINVPKTVKDPIHWILVTTLAVNTVEDAHRIVRLYTYRWLVERFHYVLKSGGCHFEESQLRTVAALHRLLAVCSRVAWRLLWLTYQTRQTPHVPCTLALSEAEWQALTALTNPSSQPDPFPPSLHQAVRSIAKLGGFIGRKSDGEPGVKTLWRGWQRLQDIVATWLLSHPPPDMGNG